MDTSTSGGQAVMLILIVLYFLPAIAAERRKHPQRMAIGVLNLFLGWTVLGWVVALVWAATAIKRPEEIVVIDGKPYKTTTRH